MKFFLLLLLVPALAHAGSWFSFEAGVGVARSKDMGDGIWVQQGAPNNYEKLDTPIWLAGITGDATEHLAWHADYVYIGTITAGCTCTANDPDYNPRTHQIIGNPTDFGQFGGQGHTQGVALTLEPNYMYKGVRLGVEAGPFLYWSTWHELAVFKSSPVNANHRTVPQLGAVLGASVGIKDWHIAYRYFYQRQKWNPYPGLVTGTHTLMLIKKF
jgi:hypothetical protein